MEIAPSYPELGEAGYGICRMRDLAWVIDRKQSRSSKELLPKKQDKETESNSDGQDSQKMQHGTWIEQH